jgi:hypothetical protein
MFGSDPTRINVTIYPSQLEWLDRIGKIMRRTRRQVFLECFSEYIGSFKHDTGLYDRGQLNE